MTAQEYIINTLKEWLSRFEGIRFNYAYDAVTEYHIVEVEPENMRRGSKEYKTAEVQLWLSFMELYPDANLLITKPSDANDMTNIVYCSEMVLEDSIQMLIEDNFKFFFDFGVDEFIEHKTEPTYALAA